MNVHWRWKKKRSGNMSNTNIDAWYDCGLANGGLGGKLIGAGGGGFLMFYTEQRDRLCNAMADAGLHQVPFRFDFEGVRVMSGATPSPALRPAIRQAA
jgi:D-glycero-alpha-D-manno-heptose-7-phosphate kinase